MNRRSLLMISGSVGLSALSGCLNSSTNEQDTTIETDFSVISPTEPLENEPYITTVKSEKIVVSGVVDVPNGCSTLVLEEGSVSISEDGSQASVTISSQDDSGDEVACTQAITPVGFKLELAITPDLPEQIVITIQSASDNTYTLEVPFRESFNSEEE